MSTVLNEHGATEIASDMYRAMWLKSHWEKLQAAIENDDPTRDDFLNECMSKESLPNDLTILGHAVVKQCTSKVLKYLLNKIESGASEGHNVNQSIPLLHLAAYAGNVEAVKVLLTWHCTDIDLTHESCTASTMMSKLDVHCRTPGSDPEVIEVHLRLKKSLKFLKPEAVPVFTRSLEENTGLTALHLAAIAGQSAVVRAFVENISSPTGNCSTQSLNVIDHQQMTPLHYATSRGDITTVEELLKSEDVKASLEESRCKLTPLDMVSILIHHTENHGFEQKLKAIKYLLLKREDVKVYLESLRAEKQMFQNATNGIVVASALIASITFAGCLHPPLGYVPYYERQYLLNGLAPPDTFATYAAVKQHPSVQVFWIFNSLAFFLAIAAILTGASAVLPIASQQFYEKAEVEHICNMHIRTSFVLSVSSICAIGAFMAAGFASLPPSIKYYWGMLGASLFGGAACLSGLFFYWRRLSRLLQVDRVPGGPLNQLRHCFIELVKPLHD